MRASWQVETIIDLQCPDSCLRTVHTHMMLPEFACDQCMFSCLQIEIPSILRIPRVQSRASRKRRTVVQNN